MKKLPKKKTQVPFLLGHFIAIALLGQTVSAQVMSPSGQFSRNPAQVQKSLAQMTQAERNAVEEAKLGRPLTAGEREVKVAMDKFLYQPKVNMPIRIVKDQWSDADELEFGSFVAAIGKGVYEKKCGTTTQCMRNPSINKFATKDPATLELYADCADFPYFLRAYFAYHKGLPFSYVTEIDVNPTAYTSVDDQQQRLEKATPADSPYGNQIVSRGGSNVPAAPGKERNFVSYVNVLINATSTATNRVGPMTPGVDRSDIFPVTLDRRGIKPGTIVAATGHAMMVWDVRANGDIRIIDGHPGSFVQEHLLVSSKIKMSRPDQGIGFYQFRPLKLIGAQQDSSGYFFGGKIVPMTNAELIQSGKLSLDQWFGPQSGVKPGDTVSPTAWKKSFSKTSFFDFVTSRLRSSGGALNPEAEMTAKLGELCSDVKDRMSNYAASQKAGIPMTPHPAALVQDIFGAKDATWEKYSTPGGDSRMREAVKDLVKYSLNLYQSAKGKVTPQDYSALMRKAVAKVNASCSINYTNSNGQKINLSLNEVTARLNRMSFDPFMCAEKTWGASGSELATCRDGDQGNRWYNAEKFMRNVIGKTDEDGNPSVRSEQEITLELLADTSLIDQPAESAVNLGTKKLPVLNLDATFASDAFIQRLSK